MQNQQVTLTIEAVHRALVKGNERYVRDNGYEAGTVSPDLHKASKFIDDTVIAYAAKLAAQSKLDQQSIIDAIANVLPVKASMRMLEFWACLAAKNYQRLDAVTALEILSAAYAGATSRDAVRFAATGKGNESTSDEVPGIETVRKLQRVMRKVSTGTEGTQNSRSFGKAGFCRILGMGSMQRDEHGTNRLIVNVGNAYVQAVKRMVEQASEGTLKLARGTTKD